MWVCTRRRGAGECRSVLRACPGVKAARAAAGLAGQAAGGSLGKRMGTSWLAGGEQDEAVGAGAPEVDQPLQAGQQRHLLSVERASPPQHTSTTGTTITSSKGKKEKNT